MVYQGFSSSETDKAEVFPPAWSYGRSPGQARHSPSYLPLLPSPTLACEGYGGVVMGPQPARPESEEACARLGPDVEPSGLFGNSVMSNDALLRHR